MSIKIKKGLLKARISGQMKDVAALVAGGSGSGGGGAVKDVKINRTSILDDGVANLNLCKGLGYNSAGLHIVNPNNIDIQRRLDNIPLTLSTLDYAVKVAMCDGEGAEWTEDEQKASQERQGIYVMTQEEYDLLDNPTGIYIITEEST